MEQGVTTDAKARSSQPRVDGSRVENAPESAVAQRSVEAAPGPSGAVRAKRSAKPRRGDAVRSRILHSALDCFGALGFEGTTARAVAKRAGVTHTLVLYHFHSMEDLWIVAVQTVLEPYADAMAINFSKIETQGAKKTLAVFIEQFIRMSAERPQIHRILTTQGQESKRLDWIIENYIRKYFVVVRDIIRRGQTEGTVREFDPARLYYFIIGAAGTLFTLSAEYKAVTGRDISSETEIYRNIAFIYEIVFVEGS